MLYKLVVVFFLLFFGLLLLQFPIVTLSYQVVAPTQQRSQKKMRLNQELWNTQPTIQRTYYPNDYNSRLTSTGRSNSVATAKREAVASAVAMDYTSTTSSNNYDNNAFIQQRTYYPNDYNSRLLLNGRPTVDTAKKESIAATMIPMDYTSVSTNNNYNNIPSFGRTLYPNDYNSPLVPYGTSTTTTTTTTNSRNMEKRIPIAASASNNSGFNKSRTKRTFYPNDYNSRLLPTGRSIATAKRESALAAVAMDYTSTTTTSSSYNNNMLFGRTFYPNDYNLPLRSSTTTITEAYEEKKKKSIPIAFSAVDNPTYRLAKRTFHSNDYNALSLRKTPVKRKKSIPIAGSAVNPTPVKRTFKPNNYNSRLLPTSNTDTFTNGIKNKESTAFAIAPAAATSTGLQQQQQWQQQQQQNEQQQQMVCEYHTVTIPTSKSGPPRQTISIEDLTPIINDMLQKSNIKNGTITVISRHTTTAITINEKESRLERDIRNYFLNLVPPDERSEISVAVPGVRYQHNDIEKRPESYEEAQRCKDNGWDIDNPTILQEWRKQEPINAHSHLISMILGSSESIPIINNKMVLGQWQSILMVDVDGPRDRTVGIQLMGYK